MTTSMSKDVNGETMLVSANRNRDRALQLLVPEILGLFWDRSQVDVLGEEVWLDDEIWLSAVQFNDFVFAISVYAPTSRTPIDKVLSLHIYIAGAESTRKPSYLAGQCSVLGWKRGRWEDRIYGEAAEPRAIETFTNCRCLYSTRSR